MRAIRAMGATVLAMCLGAPSCGIEPVLSDTGFAGTWSRGNERNVSILAIAARDGAFRFRWIKRSFDGKLSIVCGWDGNCEERLNGTLVATYTMQARYVAATGALYTDTVEERQFPERQTFRYTDQLEVTDGGTTLWSYTTERDGRHYEDGARPKRSFAKVSNAVADPPPGLLP
jgi:hypothetical protein